MKRVAGVLLFVVFGALVVLAVLTYDSPVLSAALLAAAVLVAITMFAVVPAARAALADRWPRTARLSRKIMDFRWTTIAAVLGACVAAFALAAVWKAVVYPTGDVRAALTEIFGDELHSSRPPLLAAAELEDEWPADDQRYTPIGVLLRYEHNVVAMLPDGGGGTNVEPASSDAGYRRFYAYVGDFWGPSYHRADPVPKSARAVPADTHLRAIARRLARAGRVQHICYGWDVEIRSGAREGRLREPSRLGRCSRRLRLEGWIDPHAGRFARRGSPGDWSLGYGGDIAQSVDGRSVDAISTPFVEVIEGATTEPDNHGVRAGKGLIEHLDVMPLLAQDLASVPPVPIARRDVPAGARPAPTARSDSERRADDNLFIAGPPALLQVGVGFTVVFVVVCLSAGVVQRAARALARLR